MTGVQTGVVPDEMAFPELEEPGVWPQTVPGSLHDIKRDANKRGCDTSGLTKETYDRLTWLPCHYCRRVISEKNRSGIGRIDPSRGYVAGNMEPCCATCDAAKGDQSREEFYDMCRMFAALMR